MDSQPIIRVRQNAAMADAGVALKYKQLRQISLEITANPFAPTAPTAHEQATTLPPLTQE